MRTFGFLLAILYIISFVSAIRLDLKRGKRCIYDEFDFQTVVKGYVRGLEIIPERTLFGGAGRMPGLFGGLGGGDREAFKTSLRIVDPKTNLVYSAKDLRPNERFEFSLTIQREGQYSFCFAHDSASNRMVEIDYHYEIENEFAPTEVADMRQLDPLFVQSTKLTERVERLKFEFDHAVEREHTHRDTNESTNSRLSWMIGGSLVFLIALAVGQTFYLKSYFQKKKMI